MLILLLAACGASFELGDEVCDREFECMDASTRVVLPYETEQECRSWNLKAWDAMDCTYDSDVLDACVDAWKDLSCEDVVAGVSPPECDDLCE